MSAAAMDRAITALNRAAGAVLSIPAVVARVELDTNALRLVPPHPGQKAYLAKTPQVVAGGRRARQLQKARDGASGEVRETWKGAIAGQLFAGIRESFARAGLDAPNLGKGR